MTGSEELTIREGLVGTIATASGFERVIPAPIYFTGKEDYFATMLGDDGDDFETDHEITTTLVRFAALYLKTPFEDDPNEPAHAPLTTWTYECYLFSEYDFERADETLTPDAFNKLMLKRHNDFIAAVLNVKAAFQGEINIAGMSGYTESKTLPTTIREEILNNADCEFVPGIKGHSIRLGIRVRLQTEAC